MMGLFALTLMLFRLKQLVFSVFLFLVLNIKTMFKVAAGAVFIGSAYQLLRRGSTYDQIITAVNTCVLPAGVKLIDIAKGSVILKVQAEDISALDTFWGSYSDGTLRESLQDIFVTSVFGKQVEVIVTIDQQEYENARKELISKVQGKFITIVKTK